MKHKVRLPVHVIPERYEIFLKPDLKKFTFEGEETIFVKINKSAKQLILHSAEIEIQNVEFVHGKSTLVGKISLDEKAETATFKFSKSIPTGKGQLKIKFTGILNDKMRGFYRSKYLHNGKEKYLATTQFESTDARRAFPSFDEPSNKAIFDVTLMVPKGLTAISNTLESEISEHESGYQIVKFAPTPRMSTYLLAFVVGDFEYIEGKTQDGTLVRVFTTPGKKDQAQFALSVAIKSLEFYNNYFGIDYPLPVLDMIAIPDFAAGAMENWGAVTYRESTLLVDVEKSSSANKQWVALVIAHELAHQWFGNLVTMEWWTHLWLNEGFASFIEFLAVDHIFPEWDIWQQFVATDMGDAFALDALKNTHPIEVTVGHPAEISEIFDRVSYSKGASVLRMLWKYIGEKDFQKGLQHYLKKHAYSNATTEDLWESLEKVSKKPVGKIMRNWTSKPGHPVITVTEKLDGKKLTLTQSRFFISPISKKQAKDTTVWNIPLYKMLMDKKSINIPNNGQKLNQDEVSLVRVDYPKNYLLGFEQLIQQKKLSSVDRLGLIRDVFDLSKAGNSPTTLALNFAQKFKEENEYIVWSELTAHINQLDGLLAFEKYYKDFQKLGREIYKPIAEKIGWEKTAVEKHTDALLRGMVLYRLGSFKDEETIAQAMQRFKKGNIDPDLRGVVYNLVAQNGGEKEFNKFILMYKKEDNQQEKDRIGRSLGLFQQKTLLKKTLQFAISKDVRFQNSLQIIASVWGNPNGRYLAWEFVKKNWNLLKERYAGGHYFTRVFQPAGDFTKIEDAKDIEKFVKKNPVPEAQRTIAQALEQIYANAAWLKRDKKNIQSFLQKAQDGR